MTAAAALWTSTEFGTRQGRVVDEHRVGPPDDLDGVGRGTRLMRETA